MTYNEEPMTLARCGSRTEWRAYNLGKFLALADLINRGHISQERAIELLLRTAKEFKDGRDMEDD